MWIYQSAKLSVFRITITVKPVGTSSPYVPRTRRTSSIHPAAIWPQTGLRVTENLPPLPVGAGLCARPDCPDGIIEKWFRELENKFEFTRIDKFVVMPNHIHFILSIDINRHAGPPLQKMMAWFKTMTTNDYIRGVKEWLYYPFRKRLWQRGYYEHVIRNEHDYLETWQYIVNNPIKWAHDDCFSD